MKSTFFTLLLTITSISGFAQNITLSISNPQPRLGDSIELMVDVTELRSALFKTIENNGAISSLLAPYRGEEFMKFNVGATKIGTHQIGPLQFTFNGINFSSNKIIYEVIDSLPAIDRGLWIRKVITGDSTFSILIDQRIPKLKYDHYNPNHTQNTVLTCNSLMAGIERKGTMTMTDVPDEDDYQMGIAIMKCFSIYNFKITDKTKKIELRREDFNNLPEDYKFEDIIIQ